MAMSATALKDALKGINYPANEAAACAAWADAFHTYFGDAVSGAAGAVSYTPQAACKTAMQSALAGLNASGAAAAKIQSGVTAYWSALALAITAAFSGALPLTCVPPTSLSGLLVALETVFTSNVENDEDEDAACAAIADAIHTANSGATASFPPPPAGTPQAIF
jgi:hypothetical protein